jgi:hypothetical protein
VNNQPKRKRASLNVTYYADIYLVGPSKNYRMLRNYKCFLDQDLTPDVFLKKN